MESNIIYKERDLITRIDSDSHKWIVIKVFKNVLWVKPIISNCITDDLIYKGIRKEKFKKIGEMKHAKI